MEGYAMKEYLVLMFDINNYLCGSFRTRGMNFNGVRWSSLTYDMIAYTQATIGSLIVVCLDDGKYWRYEI